MFRLIVIALLHMHSKGISNWLNIGIHTDIMSGAKKFVITTKIRAYFILTFSWNYNADYHKERSLGGLNAYFSC